jgi:hypothetical protein
MSAPDDKPLVEQVDASARLMQRIADLLNEHGE